MTLEQTLIAGIFSESTAVVALFGVMLHSYKTCERERKLLWKQIVQIYHHLPADPPRSLEDVEEDEDE